MSRVQVWRLNKLWDIGSKRDLTQSCPGRQRAELGSESQSLITGGQSTGLIEAGAGWRKTSAAVKTLYCRPGASPGSGTNCRLLPNPGILSLH